MKTRYSNGLGIALIAMIMAVTPLVPVAVSAPVPDWRWDENGRVYDASGNYVRVEMDAKQPPPHQFPELLAGSGGDSGGR